MSKDLKKVKEAVKLTKHKIDIEMDEFDKKEKNHKHDKKEKRNDTSDSEEEEELVIPSFGEQPGLL